MSKKTLTIIYTAIVITVLPLETLAINVDTDIGSGDQVPIPGKSLTCSGFWIDIICAIKQIADIINTIRDISNSLLNWVPHSFPFGGPILSSEPACRFGFNSYTKSPWPICILGFCTWPMIGPVPISWELGGKAIEIGPPVPSGGKIITFPWISKIYRHHTEDRDEPWALGLGFTPFPLDEINELLDDIRIWILAGLGPCWVPQFTGEFAECLNNFHLECVPSGKKDPAGNDVYKVIRILGTSKENAPKEALDNLKKSFPSFPWPL